MVDFKKPGKAGSAAGASPANTSAPSRDKLDELATTKVSKRGTYLGIGHYLLRINAFRRLDGFNGKGYVPDMTVVRVFPDSPDSATPVGTEVGDVMKDTNKAYMPRLRGFLDAAGNLTQETWDKEGGKAIVAQASGDDQPLAGRVVEARVTMRIKVPSQNKPRAELREGVDTYTGTDYLRLVPFSEVKETLDADDLAEYFPDIEEQVKAEAESE